MLISLLLVLGVAVQAGLGSRSVCYHTNWSQYRGAGGKFFPEDIDAHLCTHVIYAFSKIVGTQLKAFEWNDESEEWMKGMFERTMELKKKNPALKIILAVGGWNMASAPFSAIVGQDSTRKAFAKSAVNFLRKHGFDGLDNDWEYPANRGSPPQDRTNNVLFMTELRRAFDEDEASTGRSRLSLSEAIPVGKHNIDTGYDFPALSKVVDFFNVMSYDIHGAFDKVTGHNSPMFPHPKETGDARHLNVDWALNYLVSRGIPKDKINMGIPTYGRSFTLDNPKVNGVLAPARRPGVAGTYTREKGFIAYYEICKMIKSGAQVVDIPEQSVKYVLQGSQWVGYDDVQSVKQKACYAKQQGYGGVMYWALPLDDFKGSFCGQGRFPLINAANQEFRGPGFDNCPSPGATAGPQTPAPQTPAPQTQGPVQPSISPAETTRSPISSTFDCVGKENGLYPDPQSRASYIECSNEIAYHFDCPPGLVFNPAIKTCDWPYNVNA